MGGGCEKFLEFAMQRLPEHGVHDQDADGIKVVPGLQAHGISGNGPNKGSRKAGPYKGKGAAPPGKGAPPDSAGKGKGGGMSYKERQEAALRAQEERLSAERNFAGKDLTEWEARVI